jgi:cobyrinic acid a,c-diamide synthase
MAGLLVSAAHKSSGKTTVSLGLCAALSAAGTVVQPFKKGPDYIDPMWLALAAGRPCFNLDAWLMDDAALAGCFAGQSVTADLVLVEGNKGLYDGLALDGSNSNAALAARLGLPVLLVLDARGMTRGVAPLILGYQAFDKAIRIGGVVLNRVGGSRHEAKLRAVIEHYTDVPVLGAVAEDPQLAMTERHLGLMPCAEVDDARERVQAIGRIIGRVRWTWPAVRGLAATAAPRPSFGPAAQRPAGPTCASASPATAPSASTTPTIWPRCRLPAPNWCPSTPCTTACSRTSTACSSAAAFPKPAWTNCRPTRPCAPRCAARSRLACPRMPSAAA